MSASPILLLAPQERGPINHMSFPSVCVRGSVRGQEGGSRREGAEVLKMQFLSGIFQMQLLVEEIWGRNCIFQDNIRLWVLEVFVLEKITPFFSCDFSNVTTWRGDMGQKLHFSR